MACVGKLKAWQVKNERIFFIKFLLTTIRAYRKRYITLCHI